ncbi:hypothetical protein GCM10023317_26240 [Actinopolymorpha pittospori]
MWKRTTPGHALYERLGYVAYGCGPASWGNEAEEGTGPLYETTCTMLRKDLRPDSIIRRLRPHTRCPQGSSAALIGWFCSGGSARVVLLGAILARWSAVCCYRPGTQAANTKLPRRVNFFLVSRS